MSSKNFMRKYTSFLSGFVYLFVLLCSPIAAHAQPQAAGASGSVLLAEIPFALKVHIVQQHETLSLLSKKYNISESGLMYINNNPLKRFETGMTIMVPEKPLSNAKRASFEKTVKTSKVKTWLEKVATAAGEKSNGQTKEQAQAAGNKAKEALKKIAIDEASSATSQVISKWLNQYGTAKVTLGLDSFSNFGNTELDVLLPFYENKNYLSFVQGGVHYRDGRFQTNIGIGGRYLGDKYMLGANSFFDQDLSNMHARLGLGVEYWVDYLRLAANSYFGITGWRENLKEDALLEKAATGFDLRAQAYLPSYPQIGAKLELAKYFGYSATSSNIDSISSFEALKKDPLTLTLGVSYTPVPLFDISLEHRIDKNAGNNDTKLGLSTVYRFGVPLSQQLDPANLGNLRSFMGGRYELVDRNNNIVLKYKRNPDARPVDNKVDGTRSTITVIPGDLPSANGTDFIKLEIKAKTAKGRPIPGLTSDDFILTGEPKTKIFDNEEQGLIFTPAKEHEGLPGTYYVNVLSNKQGNYIIRAKVGGVDLSQTAEVQFSGHTSNISIKDTEFSSPWAVAKADDKDEIVAELRLKDKDGEPLEGVSKQQFVFSAQEYKTKAIADISFASVEEKEPGLYVTKVRSKKAGDYLISAEVAGIAINKSIKVRFEDPSADAPKPQFSKDHSSFRAKKAAAKADGKDVVILEAILRDQNDKPILNYNSESLAVYFIGDDNGVNNKNLRQEEPGIYRFYVTSTKVAKYEAFLRIDGTALENHLWVEFTEQSADAGGSEDFSVNHSEFTAVKATAKADGKDAIVLEVRLKDSKGQSLKGFSVNEFEVLVTEDTPKKATEDFFSYEILESVPGIYQIIATSKKQGDYKVSIKVSKVDFADTVRISFLGQAASFDEISIDKSKFHIIRATGEAKEGNPQPIPAIVGVYVRDDKNNLLKGLDTSAFQFSGSLENSLEGLIIYFENIREQEPGYYVVDAISFVPTRYVISLTINDKKINDKAEIEFLEAEEIDAPEKVSTYKSDFIAIKAAAEANGTDAAILEIVLKDESDKLLKGINPVSFSFEAKARASNKKTRNSEDVHFARVEEKHPGIYVVSVTSKVAGSYDVFVKIGDNLLSESKNIDFISSEEKDTPEKTSVEKTFFRGTKVIAKADGEDEVCLEISLRDDKGNPLRNIPRSAFTFNVFEKNALVKGASFVKFGEMSETVPGTYSICAVNEIVGAYTIALKVGNKDIAQQVNVQFINAEDIAKPEEIKKEKTYFNVIKAAALADGEDKAFLEIILKDENDQPLKAISSNNFKFAVQGNEKFAKQVKFGTAKEVFPGVYRVSAISQKAGIYTVSAQVANIQIPQKQQIEFIDNSAPHAIKDAELSKSMFRTIKNVAIADNIDTVRFEILLKNAKGFAIKGASTDGLSFESNPKGLQFGDVLEEKPGSYTVLARASTSGVYKVSASVAGKEFSNKEEVRFKRVISEDPVENIDVIYSSASIQSDKTSALADNKDAIAFEIIVKDEDGNALDIPTDKIRFNIYDAKSDFGPLTTANFTEAQKDTNGAYVVSMTTDVAGSYKIEILIGDKKIDFKGQNIVEFKNVQPEHPVHGVSIKNSIFKLKDTSKDMAIADGKDAISVSLIVRDENDQPINDLKGSDFNFSYNEKFGPKALTISAPIATVEPEGAGVYNAQIRYDQPAIFEVSATLFEKVFTQKVLIAFKKASEAVSLENSDISGAGGSFVADGQNKAEVKLILKDKDGKPVENVDLQDINFDFKTDINGKHAALNVDLKEDKAGVYTAQISSQVPASYTLKPMIAGKYLEKTYDLKFIADAKRADKLASHFYIKPHAIRADGVEKMSLKVELKDKDLNLLSGIASEKIKFIARPLSAQAQALDDKGLIRSSSVFEISGAIESQEEPGFYTASLTTKEVGPYKIIPEVDGVELDAVAEKVHFFAEDEGVDTINQSGSELSWSVERPVANGQDVVLTLRLKSSETGAFLSDLDSSKLSYKSFVNGKGEGAPIIGKVEQDKSDPTKYVANIHSTIAGRYSIVPYYDGKALSSLTKVITFTGDPEAVDSGQSSFVASSDKVEVGAKNGLVFTLTLKDKDGHLLSGIALDKIQFEATGSEKSGGIVFDDYVESEDGIYQARMVGHLAGSYDIVPVIAGKKFIALKKSVQVISDNKGLTLTYSNLLIKPSRINADGKQEATFILTLRDEYKQPIKALKASDIDFKVDPPLGLNDQPVYEGESSDGVYKFKLSSTVSGNAWYTPRLRKAEIINLKREFSLVGMFDTLDESKISFEIDKTNIQADKEKAILTIKLFDKKGFPLSNLDNSKITFNVETGGSLWSIPVVIEESRGQYVTTIFSPVSGIYKLTPRINNKDYKSLQKAVIIRSDKETVFEPYSDFTINGKDKIVANNEEEMSVRFFIRDERARPMVGLSLQDFSFKFEPPIADKYIKLSAFEDESGSGRYGFYNMRLRSSIAGKYRIIPVISGNAMDTKAKNVTFIGNPDAIVEANSKFILADGDLIEANDITRVRATLMLKDADGNALSGIDISKIKFIYEPTIADQVVIDNYKEDPASLGSYTADIRARVPGCYSIVPSIEGRRLDGLIKDITFIGNKDRVNEGYSLLSLETPLVADNETKGEVKIQLYDSSHNPMTGIPGERFSFYLEPAPKAGEIVFDPVVEAIKQDPKAEKGLYVTKFRSDISGNYRVKLKLQDRIYGNIYGTVTLVGDIKQLSPTETTLQVKRDSIIANGADNVEFELRPKDGQGRPLANISLDDIKIISNRGAGSIEVYGWDGPYQNGIYKAKIRSHKSGLHELHAQIGGTSIKETLQNLKVRGDINTANSGNTKFVFKNTETYADGGSSLKGRISLKDATGQSLACVEDRFFDYEISSPAGTNIQRSQLVEVEEGEYEVDFHTKVAAPYTVTLKINGQKYEATRHVLQFKGVKERIKGSDSELRVTRDRILGDGVENSTIIIGPKDVEGHWLWGLDVKDIKLIAHRLDTTRSSEDVSEDSSEGEDESLPKIGPITPVESMFGHYQATISAKTSGLYEIEARIADRSFTQRPKIKFTGVAVSASPKYSTFVMGGESDHWFGDYIQVPYMLLTLRDKHDHALLNIDTSKLSFRFADGATPDGITLLGAQEIGSGQYKLLVKSRRGGTYKVIPYYEENGIKYDLANLSADMIFESDPVRFKPEFSTLEITRSVQADGESKGHIKLIARDWDNCPVTNSRGGLTFVVEPANMAEFVQLGEIKEDPLGTYEVYFTATVSGNIKISPLVGEKHITEMRQNVSLTGDTANVSEENSKLTTSVSEIVNNGLNTLELTLTLADKAGAPLANLTSDAIEIIIDPALDAKEDISYDFISNDDERSKGIYKYRVKALGSVSGYYKITPKVKGKRLNGLTTELKLKADIDKASQSATEAKLEKESALADGKDSIAFEIILKDNNNKIMAAVEERFFDFDIKTAGTSSSLTRTWVGDKDKPGHYVVKFTATASGSYSITPKINNRLYKGCQKEIKFSPDIANFDPSKAKFTITPNEIIADGKTEAKINLELQDKSGNWLAGLTDKDVKFTVQVSGANTKAEGHPLIKGFMEVKNNPGRYEASITSSISGQYNVEVAIGDQRIENPVSITFKGDPKAISAKNSKLSSDVTAVEANGEATAYLILDLKDDSGNPLIKLDPSLISYKTINGGNKKFDFTATEEIAPGRYKTGVKTIKSGEYGFMPHVGDENIDGLHRDIFFKGDIKYLDLSKSSVKMPSELLMADEEASFIKIKLFDKDGDALVGLDPDNFTLEVAPATSEDAISWEDKPKEDSFKKGVYSARIFGKAPGKYNVTLHIGDKTFPSTTVEVHKQGQIIDETHSQMIIRPESVVAGKEAFIELSLKDENNNIIEDVVAENIDFDIVSDIEDGISIKNETKAVIIEKAVVIKDSPGSFKAKINTKTAGFYFITPVVKGKKLKGLKHKFSVTPVDTTVSEDKSTFILDQALAPEEGKTSSLELRLMNDKGFGISNIDLDKIRFDVSPSDGVFKIGNLEESQDTPGIYKAKLELLEAGKTGDYKITPVINGKSLSKLETRVVIAEFNTDPQGTLDAQKTLFSIKPNVILSITNIAPVLTFIPRDKDGKILTHIDPKDISFRIKNIVGMDITDSSSATISAVEQDSAYAGVYTARLNFKWLLDVLTIVPVYKGKHLDNLKVTVSTLHI